MQNLDYKLFPQNKYSKYYIKLIESRKFQEKEKFKTEKHHIFPICVFDKNSIYINLKHKEHFIAHLLLWKMYKNTKYQYPLAKAIECFKNMKSTENGRISSSIIKNSKIFSKIKEDSSIARSITSKLLWQDPAFRLKQKSKVYTAESKAKMSKSATEKFKNNPQLKDEISKFQKERTNTPEYKAKRSEQQKKLSANPEYTRKRIEAMTTPEATAKMSASLKAKYSQLSKEEKSKKFGLNAGKMWITDGVNSKTILKTEGIPEGYRKGRVIITK